MAPCCYRLVPQVYIQAPPLQAETRLNADRRDRIVQSDVGPDERAPSLAPRGCWLLTGEARV